jgi:hypothetical protein
MCKTIQFDRHKHVFIVMIISTGKDFDGTSSGVASGRSRVVLTTRAVFCIISRQCLGSMLTVRSD